MLKRQTPRSTAFLCQTQKKSSFDGVSTPSKVNKKRSKKIQNSVTFLSIMLIMKQLIDSMNNYSTLY